VRSSDPVGHLTLSVVVPTSDRADRPPGKLDGSQEDGPVVPHARPALVERGSVLGVGGREGRHLQRIVVVPVLEEGVEIAVFDLPQDHHGPDDRS